MKRFASKRLCYCLVSFVLIVEWFTLIRNDISLAVRRELHSMALNIIIGSIWLIFVHTNFHITLTFISSVTSKVIFRFIYSKENFFFFDSIDDNR